jgi:hypothetical protein
VPLFFTLYNFIDHSCAHWLPTSPGLRLATLAAFTVSDRARLLLPRRNGIMACGIDEPKRVQ